MARTISPAQVHRHHFTLNTDGVRHPLENVGSVLTAVFGLCAALCAFFPSMHLLGSWTGLAGLATGAWSQMISATTAERWINICAIVLSGIGLLFGLAHGGLY
jgi:hypothetical protein